MTQPSNDTPNFKYLSEKGREVYDTLEEQFKKDNAGKYIAIEVQLDNGEYFIGDTRDEAVQAAKSKYPNKLVFVRRVGNLENLSRHIKHTVRG